MSFTFPRASRDVVGGTAQRITTQGNKWVFRSPVPDTKLVSDLADFIHEKFPKFTKFAFLYVKRNSAQRRHIEFSDVIIFYQIFGL